MRANFIHQRHIAEWQSFSSAEAGEPEKADSVSWCGEVEADRPFKVGRRQIGEIYSNGIQ
jgi:hypothetical protein